MLGRLAELRELAGTHVEVPAAPADSADPEQEKVPEAKKDATAQLDDDEYVELINEMTLQYNEILGDEGVVNQAFEEVRQRVDNMEELVVLQKTALLPSKLQQLANRFEGQELVCQRMIRRAKEALVALRAEDADVDDDDIVHISLAPVRSSIARVRGMEFKRLVQGFFTARAHNREEMLKRASRQLRYAYPDALEEELSDILEFPELAAVAIAQRLEKGAEGVTLDGILAQMEGKKADARMIEQGAKELKLMFLQFAELIDNQGEALTAIESNIKIVIDETTEAIGHLLDAEGEKRAYQRKWFKFYIIAFILFLWFIVWPAYDALFNREKGNEDGHEQGRLGRVAARIGDGFKYFGNAAFAFGHRAYKATEEKGHEAFQAAEEELAHAEQGQSSQPEQGRKPGGAASLSQISEAQIGQRRFIAPRRRHFPMHSSSLIDDSILQQIALTARGKAARQSSLRKSRLSPKEE